MEVILIERMANLGNIGEVVNVKNGYARNFLLPQKKALRATKDNVAYFEAKRAEIEARNADAKKAAEKLAKDVEGKVVNVIRAASDDGRLYGSVSARDIAVALSDKETIARDKVDLNVVIKELGIYDVRVVLHPEVVVNVKINVARSESEAAEALKGKAKKSEKKAKSAIEKLTEEEAAEEVAEDAPAEETATEEAASKDESAA